MSGLLGIRIGIAILILSFFLYRYIEKQNEIVNLRLQIPQIERELLLLCEENTGLQFQVDQFENPTELIKIWRRPEWRHLKQPLEDEIITFEVDS